MQAGPQWAVDILARIRYRSMNDGNEPTEDEIQALLTDKAELQKVTTDDILRAYSSGKEVSVSPIMRARAESIIFKSNLGPGP